MTAMTRGQRDSMMRHNVLVGHPWAVRRHVGRRREWPAWSQWKPQV